jgi:hypothetical protein
MGEHITISKKTIKAFLVFALISLPSTGLCWFLFCDKIEIHAQTKFNDRFDKHFPAAHRPCSLSVAENKCRIEKTDAAVQELKSKLDFLVISRSVSMTWEEKQKIVERLRKNDSTLSYTDAYKIVNNPMAELNNH